MAMPDDVAADERLCPSAPVAEEAQLIGIVRGDGTVGFLGRPLTIDSAFVAVANEGRDPAARFRAASPCLRSGCVHWADGSCGVASAARAIDAPPTGDSLPRCGIRRSCRWFSQEGVHACAVCPRVVTSAAPSDSEQPPLQAASTQPGTAPSPRAAAAGVDRLLPAPGSRPA